MKIFYCPDVDLKFERYGIQIPIAANRAQQVFTSLDEIQKHGIFDLSLELNRVLVENIPEINREDLLLCHQIDFVEKIYQSESSLRFQMLKAFELIDENGQFYRYNPHDAKENFQHAFNCILKQVGLTYWSTKMALTHSFSYFLGGGMHHAMTFGGRGFCLVNDIMITLLKLKKEKLINSAWVIDVDAHKGDGTAEMAKSDPSITTLSIHMQEGWPLNFGSRSEPWFIPSSIDIGVLANEEDLYLVKLKNGLLELKNKYPRPDVAIIVNGADPYELDELPSSSLIQLSKEAMLKRDLLVYEFLKELHIPQSYVMAGGYGSNSWEIYFQFLEFVGKSSP